jgi:Flp pilus assembly protein TadB
MLALGLAPAALGEDETSPTQPSAIERLVRQENARATQLARLDGVARQNDLSTTLDARERAMVGRPESASLDPAIRTAMVARASAAAATASGVTAAQAGDDTFAWGAAALGLGAGVAAMCVLLACVTLARSHGRLRSV